MEINNEFRAQLVASDKLKYRPDIDGLRALAVLAVVIFHAFPSALPGGFVGVDIFFVISGYLITGILITDLQAGRFAISRFYARRIRRIFPSLAVVLLATYVMGWFSLYGDEYKELGKQILAAVGFISNWTLWAETGYFDQASATKPLLHLWSLGVEEQFYIVWPLLLALVVKYGRAKLLGIAIALLSFSLNIWLIRHHASAAFFLPFGRFWELLVGAALAVRWQSQCWNEQETWIAHGLSGLGLLLCVASFLGLNSQLAFPGWWALLPVLGAAFLLAAGGSGFVNRRLLSNSASIRIGKISYALYLWHWPLLSFITIVAGNAPSPTIRAGVVLLSVILAWITTEVVERPIRFGSPYRSKIIIPCVAMLVVGYLGGITYVRQGLAFRKGYSLNADVTTARLGAGHEFVNLNCGVPSKDQHLFQFCATDKRALSHYALWGDSKADALYWGLVRASPPGQSWTLIARAGCAPMDGVERVSSLSGDDPRECSSANQKALQMLLDNKNLTTVVLAVANRDTVGPVFMHIGVAQTGPSLVLDGLDNVISELRRGGKRVALVLDNPALPDPRLCMDREPLAWPVVRRVLGVSSVSASERCSIPYSTYLSRTHTYLSLMDQLKQRHADLTVYDPAPILCDIRNNVCPMTMNRNYLYSYGAHISDYANSRIATQLLPILMR